MAGMKTLIIIFVIMFPVAMITEEDVNHGVCPVPMNKEEEEFIKERERNRELMEEIAREIEITCLDECKAELHNCHDDAYCTNTKRSFTCTCKPGYTGDGVNCADINECNTGKHNCDIGSSACHNTIGSFGCVCKEGYSKNRENTCTDINECEAGKHNCHANANCKNTKGSFVCTCKPGYSGNGVNCTDVNECITGKHNCYANADCNNTEGSFECTCKPGYSGNGVNCTGDYFTVKTWIVLMLRLLIHYYFVSSSRV
ncbi:unnamed protein product [Porites evermanni]|uniref:EGF-like domain-containing protein n=1 Tax=Porites evermanni TaxID=104178 RepID=A0ABN8SPZ9_9CNID|nr:unnamed protein product [Porites evermanni]